MVARCTCYPPSESQDAQDCRVYKWCGISSFTGYCTLSSFFFYVLFSLPCRSLGPKYLKFVQFTGNMGDEVWREGWSKWENTGCQEQYAFWSSEENDSERWLLFNSKWALSWLSCWYICKASPWRMVCLEYSMHIYELVSVCVHWLDWLE